MRQSFRSELARQAWNRGVQESFAARVLSVAGTGKNLLDFAHKATSGSYQVMARKLIDGRILETTVLPGGVSRDRVQRLAVMVAERRPLTDTPLEPAARIGGYLNAFQISLDLASAITGDDGAYDVLHLAELADPQADVDMKVIVGRVIERIPALHDRITAPRR